MFRGTTYAGGRLLARILFATAAAVLAIEPALWLGRTWRDPSYDSKGFLVLGLCAGLFGWSASSPRISAKPANVRLAIALLAATACIRLAGQVLAVNTIGAIALIIDVYAIALLSGLQHRARSVSPGWLAICFGFSLPLERIVQRTIGYSLQHVSADGACMVLDGLFGDVVCNGIRILLEGKDVLVDLPCSGARAILLLLLFFAVVASLCRPRLHQAANGFAVTLGAGLATNVLRIVGLAIGIAFPEWLAGIDVMAQPWHDAIGLALLALGCVPILVWAHTVRRRPHQSRTGSDLFRWTVPSRVARDGWWLQAPRANSNVPVLLGCGFLALALVIVNLPRKAIDVAKRDISIVLPDRLAGLRAERTTLSAREKAYFVQFGGAAAKADYGPNSLLIVRTSAPLRHLHAPDECLRGLGLEVEYLGPSYRPVPTAVYRATTADGRAYRIDATFVSDRGHVTTNVAEAVWHWLQAPGSVWSTVQRISPWDTPNPAHAAFEHAVAAAFDLPTLPKPAKSASLKGAPHNDR
ncbi:MAG: exosortase T [Methyloligellaceae bacterium]